MKGAVEHVRHHRCHREIQLRQGHQKKDHQVSVRRGHLSITCNHDLVILSSVRVDHVQVNIPATQLLRQEYQLFIAALTQGTVIMEPRVSEPSHPSNNSFATLVDVAAKQQHVSVPERSESHSCRLHQEVNHRRRVEPNK